MVEVDRPDMIPKITLAMTRGLRLGRIGITIHPYLTQAEARKLSDRTWCNVLESHFGAYFARVCRPVLRSEQELFSC